jgi:hypothetical protein
VERGAFVAEAVLARRELAEVTGCLRYHIVIELESDAAGGLVANGDVKLSPAISMSS